MDGRGPGACPAREAILVPHISLIDRLATRPPHPPAPCPYRRRKPHPAQDEATPHSRSWLAMVIRVIPCLLTYTSIFILHKDAYRIFALGDLHGRPTMIQLLNASI